MYQKILVTHDGSALSQKGVVAAIKLAAIVKAQIVALYVAPRAASRAIDGGAPKTDASAAFGRKQSTDSARDLIDSVGVSALAAGVCAEAIVIESDTVGESIVAAAIKHGCDLVVMASRGRSGIKQLMLGSQTSHVLANSSISVLVLR